MNTRMLPINPSCLHLVLPWILWKLTREDKTVYLTFDDGPHPEYTSQLLQILNMYQIKGTFFILGEKAEKYPGIINRLHTEGHSLGNHGYSHIKSFYIKEQVIREEICRTESALKKITNEKPIWFRPPYGRFDFRYKRIMEDLGYRMVMWSLLSYDFQEKDPNRLIQRVHKHSHTGAILVFHDDNPNTPIMLEALPKIIKIFTQEGYQFKKLDHQHSSNTTRKRS